MKFSCVRENLSEALEVAERFTGKNITLPILANVLLETKGNDMTVTATNLEYAVEFKVSGKVYRDGKVSVPGKIFNSLIQSLEEEKIELEGRSGNLFVHSNRRDTRINGLGTEDFPLIPRIKKAVAVEIETQQLKSGMEKLLPAVSVAEFKPELTGVYVELLPKTVKLAATDTFRLAEKVFPLKRKDGENFSFILPHRVALELSRILSGEDEVRVSMGENQVFFEIGNAKITSRLIEGNFPEYSGIIPKTYETTAFLNRSEFIRAVRSASIFSSKIQEVTLRFEEKELEVSSSNTEIGEYRVRLPVDFTGKDLTISFNYRYLLDGLQSLDDEELFLGINKDTAPSLFRNKSDGSFSYVLMPIRPT